MTARVAVKQKPGRKEWVDEKIIARIEGMAANGLTIEQIVHNLPVQKHGYYQAKQRFPEIDEAIKRGRSKGLAVVTNALFKSARNGNIAAIIFYLKNRAPDHWSDKQHQDVNFDREISITVNPPSPTAIESTHPQGRETPGNQGLVIDQA